MTLRCVWSRNLENEVAKARYLAVKIQPQWVVNPGKQTNKREIQSKDSLLIRWFCCCCFVVVVVVVVVVGRAQ